MKKIILSFLILISNEPIFAQQLVSTSGTKSAILVGSDLSYAGLGYESGSDKFSFNYKFVKQKGNPFGSGLIHSKTWGINLAADANVEKAKSSLVADEKWQGGVSFDGTIFYSFFSKSGTSIGTTETEYGPDNLEITHFDVKDMTVITLFFRVADGLNRINTFETRIQNADTIFASLKDPMQNILTFTPGVFVLRQWRSKFYLSGGLSFNLGFNNRSTLGLKEVDLLPTSTVLLNSKDSTRIQQVGKQKSYFAGPPESEIVYGPRVDLFFRWRFDKDKPVIGLLAAYSPILSSISNAKTRNCFAFGPTFGLPSFPDQVVFGIINEFNQNKDGDYKYALNLQATFPIKFK